MIRIYKSAQLFHTNLQTKNISGIEGKVTHYEVAADGLQFEKDFTLRITENVSMTDNSTVYGKYTCYFGDAVDTGMYGEVGNNYIYNVNSDDITLNHEYVHVEYEYE